MLDWKYFLQPHLVAIVVCHFHTEITMTRSFKDLKLFYQHGGTYESENVIAIKLANLKHFWQLVQDCKLLRDVYLLMQDFVSDEITLLERADLSTIYTPRALELINTESANKFLVLDELATLCWQHRSE